MDNTAELVESVQKTDSLYKTYTENNLTFFEFKRFTDDYLALYYDKLINEGNSNLACYKGDNPSINYKICRCRISLNKEELVQAVIDYYLSLFEYCKNTFFEKNKRFMSDSLIRCIEEGGKYNVSIIKDKNLEQHKINAQYKLNIGNNYVFTCSLVESGNCCGSMTIYRFHRDHDSYKLFTKLFINMIYDIAIMLNTPNLIALVPSHYSYCTRLKELHGFKSVHSFKNRNSGNNVEILTKELSGEFLDEKIIIKI